VRILRRSKKPGRLVYHFDAAPSSLPDAAASSELIREAAMTRPLTDETIFHFGNFEFDASTFELRREGSLVRLQSQPAQVLALLLENHERTVSREELKSAIWGEATFVDFERGLNFCVSQVRSALKDSSSNSLYVRTFPKNGYRFVAPVICSIHSSAEVSQQPNAPRRFSLFTRRSVIWFFAISGGLMILALVGVIILAVLGHVSNR
jgi:DNA-binding winged helix-turn-helix (wHTH) protein